MNKFSSSYLDDFIYGTMRKYVVDDSVATKMINDHTEIWYPTYFAINDAVREAIPDE